MIIKQIWQNGESAKLPTERALKIAKESGYASVKCISNDIQTGIVIYQAAERKH